MVAINPDIECGKGLKVAGNSDGKIRGFAGWRYTGSGRRRDRAKPLVSRFRSSQTSPAPSDANFGIKGTLATLCFYCPLCTRGSQPPSRHDRCDLGFGALVAVDIGRPTMRIT